jgi:hypothetical protein
MICTMGLVLRAYLDCFDLQLQRGIFVDNDHWMRMGLKAGKSPHVVYTAFYALL